MAEVGNYATSKGASQKQIVSKTIDIQHHIVVYHVHDFISNLIGCGGQHNSILTTPNT